jgi:hypothetical protein
VTAVLQARADTAAPEDSFYLALRHSLPDAAWGRPVDGTALLAVHRAAWEIARLKHGTLKDLLREPDAVRRLALAIRADALSPTERGEIVSDSYASLDRISRLATAAVTMQQLADHAELPASTLEPIAADYASFAGDTDVSVTVQRGGADWKRQILGSWLAGLDLGTTRGKSLGNIAAVLLRDDDPFEPARLEQAYDHAASCVSPPSADAQPRKKTRRKKVA